MEMSITHTQVSHLSISSECIPPLTAGCVNFSFAYVEGESLLMAMKDVALSSGRSATIILKKIQISANMKKKLLKPQNSKPQNLKPRPPAVPVPRPPWSHLMY